MRRAARAPRPTRPASVRPARLPSGEVAEWSKAPHSKCGVRATVPWVRIPPSPPRINRTSFFSILQLTKRDLRATARGRFTISAGQTLRAVVILIASPDHLNMLLHAHLWGGGLHDQDRAARSHRDFSEYNAGGRAVRAG